MDIYGALAYRIVDQGAHRLWQRDVDIVQWVLGVNTKLACMCYYLTNLCCGLRLNPASGLWDMDIPNTNQWLLVHLAKCHNMANGIMAEVIQR